MIHHLPEHLHIHCPPSQGQLAVKDDSPKLFLLPLSPPSYHQPSEEGDAGELQKELEAGPLLSLD